MTFKKSRKKVLSCLLLCGGLLLQSCAGAAPLLSLPLTTFFSGAELALKGGDIYKQMKRADGRRAFELTFDEVWTSTLNTLRDLSFVTEKEALNEENDGGVIEVKNKGGKISIAVVKLNDKVSEVGVWAKGDHALATLILSKIDMQDEECETMSEEVSDE